VPAISQRSASGCFLNGPQMHLSIQLISTRRPALPSSIVSNCRNESLVYKHVCDVMISRMENQGFCLMSAFPTARMLPAPITPVEDWIVLPQTMQETLADTAARSETFLAVFAKFCAAGQLKVTMRSNRQPLRHLGRMTTSKKMRLRQWTLLAM
jgi:hypothetical protein